MLHFSSDIEDEILEFDSIEEFEEEDPILDEDIYPIEQLDDIYNMH